MWQRLSTQILYNGFPKVWANSYKLIDVHCWELIRSVGSHGSLSMVFVMKVMVWHCVSDSHKVVTALFSCYISSVVGIFLQCHMSSELGCTIEFMFVSFVLVFAHKILMLLAIMWLRVWCTWRMHHCYDDWESVHCSLSFVSLFSLVGVFGRNEMHIFIWWYADCAVQEWAGAQYYNQAGLCQC
jgi:hypothetical protein